MPADLMRENIRLDTKTVISSISRPSQIYIGLKKTLPNKRFIIMRMGNRQPDDSTGRPLLPSKPLPMQNFFDRALVGGPETPLLRRIT